MLIDQDNFSEKYDDLVIGAGSAGAVIASRLSENPNRRVLLLEAGPDTSAFDASIQQAIRDVKHPAVAPGLNWKFPIFIKGNAARNMQSPSRSPSAPSSANAFDYVQAGKVLGGSSAVNAVQALRGMPADYDEWAIECGEEWSWSKVLPYFRLLEDDPIGSDSLHGRGGPMPIRRERKEDLTPLQASLMEACIAHGFAETEDHNDPQTTGVGIIPKNVVDGIRMSTAITYLASARGRPNLKIITDVHVHRLIWNGAAVCKGVEGEVAGKAQQFFADRVILCAGVMSTPAILMRSGIGAPSTLESLGVAVRSPLTGVGENLMDHPLVGIWGVPKSGICMPDHPWRQTLLRYSSSDSGYENDMHICMMAGLNTADSNPGMSSSSWSPIAGVTACFNKSRSRGTLRLSSADPHAMPVISMNCLGEKSDMPPLKEGIRLAWQLLQRSELRSHFEGLVAWTDGMIRSDVAVERAVMTFVRSSAHVCGTAKMGSSPDHDAVVDPRGRVFGVDNLWVADASIMPRIPSAPTHLTTLMIAEKIAAELQKMH